MARAIQFHAPNTPNFSEANELTRLSMDYANNAVKDVKTAWDTAVQNVRDKNHAEMKQLIDAYNYEQLQDPNVRNQIQQDIQSIGLPTGNMYDPTVVQTYLDTRGDTLLKRDEAIHDYKAKQFDYDSKVLQDKVTKAGVAVDFLRNQLKPNTDENKEYNSNIISQINTIINDYQFGDNLAYAKGAMANYSRDNTYKDLEQQIKQRAVAENIKSQQSKRQIAEGLYPLQYQQGIADLQYARAKTDGQIINNAQQTNKPSPQEQQVLERNKARADAFIKNFGGNPAVLNNDGSVNSAMLKNEFELGMAKFGLENSISYSDYIDKHGADLLAKNKNLTPAKLNDFFTVINKHYPEQGLSLTEHQKIAITQALATGQLEIDGWFQGSWFDNYQTTAQKEINHFLKEVYPKTQFGIQENNRKLFMHDFYQKVSPYMNPQDLYKLGIIDAKFAKYSDPAFVPKHILDAQAKKEESKSTNTKKENLVKQANEHKPQPKVQFKAPAIGGGVFGL